MKIFLISNMYPSKDDSLFGVFVKNFKEEMESQGVKFSAVSVIYGKSNSALKKLVKYFLHYLSIFKNFILSRFDVLYIHYLTHHLPILFFLIPFKNKIWVINTHGNDIVDLENRGFFKMIACIILRKADLIVVPSSYFKKEVLKNYTFLSDSAIYISPSGGVDPEIFYVKHKKDCNNILHLGFVSRLIEEKGWKTFLEALVKLQEKEIPFKATLAGKGPDEVKIKSYIKKNKLTQVNFLGFVNQNELVHLYNNFDLYIFPTYRESESLGLTGLEAMSCGTPVAACNIAGPSTYIKNGVNGYLFEPKDSEQLSDCIYSFLKLKTSEKEKMIQKALKYSRDFEKSKVAKRLIKKIKQVVYSG